LPWKRRSLSAQEDNGLRILVAQMPLTTTAEELEQLLHPYGIVDRVQSVIERETGRSRGFGFVAMPNTTEAHAAIAGPHGTVLGGRTRTVNEERPWEERRPRW